MSLIKANSAQIGQSATATQNFTLAVPASPDGTVKLARGNSGATTQDVLKVTSAGVVQTPQNVVAFSAYQSSAQSAIAALTPTKVQLQTKEFDTTSAFDATTNYRFQPTVAGYYQIIGSVQANGTTAFLFSSLYKNGSNIKNGVYLSSSSPSPISVVTVVVYLNGSTDYVELWAVTGTTIALVASSVSTYFQGHLLGAA